jgi:CTP synthase (UTP-ammonia lyase)
LRVALVGDFDESVTAHRAIPIALKMVGLQGEWVHTASITDAETQLRPYAAIWCVPASPYANAEGAFSAIRFARERGVPFLGTCGGFQHAVIEYARNVLGMADADHAETAPDAAMPLISRLSCSLVETTQELTVAEGSLLAKAYGRTRIDEGYRCNFGLNPKLAERLWDGSLRPAAHDGAGEVRAVELVPHPFFAATLFQPERGALLGQLPPLVRAVAEAIVDKG